MPRHTDEDHVEKLVSLKVFLDQKNLFDVALT